MTKIFFQNFQKSPTYEFFCDFFCQTLNFYCQSCYGQIFFKFCIRALENIYFKMSKEKKSRFSSKARNWPLKATMEKNHPEQIVENMKNFFNGPNCIPVRSNG